MAYSKWIDNLGLLFNRGIRVKQIAQFLGAPLRLIAPTGQSYCEIKTKTLDLTLSGTAGASPQASANWLPANSFLLGMSYRILIALAGGTSFKIGDGSDDDRFFAAQTTYTAGTTGRQAVLAALQQAAAGDLSVAWTGTMTAGKLRITLFYIEFTAGPRE